MLLGSVLVFGVLNQLTRQLPGEVLAAFPAARTRQVIIGLVLIGILLTRPDGLVPERFKVYKRPATPTPGSGV